jgi:uncharacterized protein
MNLVILAASGRTGLALTAEALARGHSVRAVARDPSRIRVDDTPQLTKLIGDIYAPEALLRAIGTDAIVLSVLGVTKQDRAGLLTEGARALIALRPERILWLGAYGSGQTATAAGWPTRSLLSLMGARLADKVAADDLVLAAGGTVFHAGPLSSGQRSEQRRNVSIAEAPKQFFPSRVNRATVAACMLDEIESPNFARSIAIPLER